MSEYLLGANGRRLLIAYGWLLILFIIVPALVLVPVSIGKDDSFVIIPHELSLRWYQTLFTDTRWRNALILSLKLAVFASVLATVAGVLAAIGVSRAAPQLAKALRLLFIAPMIVPLMVIGVGFYVLYARLRLLGGFVPLGAAHAVLVLPFVMLPVSARLYSMDQRLEWAAASLGAGPYQTIIRVVLPQLKPAILAGFAFAFIFAWLGGSLGGLGWVAIPLVIALGGLIGLLNGLVHVKLKIPSFMASLAIGFVGTGAAVLLTGGDIVKVGDASFRGLLTVRWLGFPLMVYVAAFFLLVAWFIQTHTTLGRNFYAVGGGEDLAHASGLNVTRVRVTGFALAGIFYAIAAILVVARIGQAESVTGANFMFVSITSVVVGGVALWGGIGGVWNALVGVLIVGVIDNGMVVIGLPDFIQAGVLGILVILAVVLSTDRKMVSFVK